MNIKELAEQAGVIFDTDPTYTYGASPKVLKRFAELVAAAERAACMEVCKSVEEHSLKTTMYGAASEDYKDGRAMGANICYHGIMARGRND